LDWLGAEGQQAVQEAAAGSKVAAENRMQELELFYGLRCLSSSPIYRNTPVCSREESPTALFRAAANFASNPDQLTWHRSG
jgi:hypothetical protein